MSTHQQCFALAALSALAAPALAGVTITEDNRRLFALVEVDVAGSVDTDDRDTMPHGSSVLGAWAGGTSASTTSASAQVAQVSNFAQGGLAGSGTLSVFAESIAAPDAATSEADAWMSHAFTVTDAPERFFFDLSFDSVQTGDASHLALASITLTRGTTLVYSNSLHDGGTIAESFDLATGAYNLQIQFRAESHASDGETGAIDMTYASSFVAPAPAGIALLGMGVAGTARRRRA